MGFMPKDLERLGGVWYEVGPKSWTGVQGGVQTLDCQGRRPGVFPGREGYCSVSSLSIHLSLSFSISATFTALALKSQF